MFETFSSFVLFLIIKLSEVFPGGKAASVFSEI